MSLVVGWRILHSVCMLSLASGCALPALAQERMPATHWAATASVERGRVLLANRQDSGCILCHTVPGIAAGGDIGPPLAGLAGRADAAQIRQRIANARSLNPETIMPPYFSTRGVQRVAGAYAGQTVLSGQGLEDVVAYLLANTRSRTGAAQQP
jgi:sulfur-oxidizing protein SoxX